MEALAWGTACGVGMTMWVVIISSVCSGVRIGEVDSTLVSLNATPNQHVKGLYNTIGQGD